MASSATRRLRVEMFVGYRESVGRRGPKGCRMPGFEHLRDGAPVTAPRATTARSPRNSLTDCWQQPGANQRCGWDAQSKDIRQLQAISAISR